jgi:hypothetical protein
MAIGVTSLALQLQPAGYGRLALGIGRGRLRRQRATSEGKETRKNAGISLGDWVLNSAAVHITGLFASD